MNQSLKDKKIVVSILIAVKDRKQMLKKLMNSIYEQTYKDLEVIIVDNGSALPLNYTDFPQVPEHLKESIIYTSIPRDSIAEARNMTMEKMTGQFFFVADSDDYLDKDCIAELVRRAIATGADIVYPKLQYFEEEDKPLNKFFGSSPCTLETALKIKSLPHQCLYRTETLGKYRYDEQFKSAVDYDFLLNILKDGKRKITDGGEAVYYYRDHMSQETKFERQMDAVEKIKEKYKKYL